MRDVSQPFAWIGDFSKLLVLITELNKIIFLLFFKTKANDISTSLKLLFLT